MKLAGCMLGSILLSLAVGCSSSSSQVTDEAMFVFHGGPDRDLALADVPANIREAALRAVPGLVLRSAEKEMEDGVWIYSLEGTAGEEEYCVEVSLEGQVLEVENEDDDDDADDDDDDADDDD